MSLGRCVADAGGGRRVGLQGTPVHVRAAQPLTHASLFATLKQFREQQHVRVEDEDLAHF
jgi:hypothetical protein